MTPFVDEMADEALFRKQYLCTLQYSQQAKAGVKVKKIHKKTSKNE